MNDLRKWTLLALALLMTACSSNPSDGTQSGESRATGTTRVSSTVETTPPPATTEPAADNEVQVTPDDLKWLRDQLEDLLTDVEQTGLIDSAILGSEARCMREAVATLNNSNVDLLVNGVSRSFRSDRRPYREMHELSESEYLPRQWNVGLILEYPDNDWQRAWLSRNEQLDQLSRIHAATFLVIQVTHVSGAPSYDCRILQLHSVTERLRGVHRRAGGGSPSG